ncbi:MAG TPA: chemotaxis protein CheD [Polyangiaceae bacterium]|nr:chemotaxis protein CheD [Polyangiaceae bacterium]
MTAAVATRPLAVTLHIGGVYAADHDVVVRTVLGSCIAACLYDPVARVGGMNHFMLPTADGSTGHADQTRYGSHAMEVLIGAVQRLGGRRDRLQAKVFGGGHVLQTAPAANSVPARNIAFIERFIRDEKLQLVSQDLGGFLARRVHFYPYTGRALVKRLGQGALRELRMEELQAQQLPPAEPDNDITLFDD